jgi:hypothetical protein
VLIQTTLPLKLLLGTHANHLDADQGSCFTCSRNLAYRRTAAANFLDGSYLDMRQIASRGSILYEQVWLTHQS